MDIHSLVEEKISADADFQAELELMSDEEQAEALASKKAELTKQEFDAIDAKAKKDAELATNYKIRAEKAEREAKAKPAGEVAPTNTENYSLGDIRALSDVHDDDVESVVNWAKFKNIPIAEAKKSAEMQSLMRNREEERKTAMATSTGTSRRSTSKNTGEAILERAMRGELPESDEDIAKLSEARLQARINAHKS